MKKQIVLALFFAATPLAESKKTNYLLPESTDKVPYKEIGRWIKRACPEKYAQLNLVDLTWCLDGTSYEYALYMPEENNHNVVDNIPSRKGTKLNPLPWRLKEFYQKVFCKYPRYMHLLVLKKKMFFVEKNHKGKYTKLFSPLAKAYYLSKEFGNAPKNIVINILAYSEPVLIPDEYEKKIVRPAFFHNGELMFDYFVDEDIPKTNWQIFKNITLEYFSMSPLNRYRGLQHIHVSSAHNINNNNSTMVTQAAQQSSWQDNCIVM